jgi:hypothetical protein
MLVFFQIVKINLRKQLNEVIVSWKLKHIEKSFLRWLTLHYRISRKAISYLIFFLSSELLSYIEFSFFADTKQKNKQRYHIFILKSSSFHRKIDDLKSWEAYLVDQYKHQIISSCCCFPVIFQNPLPPLQSLSSLTNDDLQATNLQCSFCCC